MNKKQSLQLVLLSTAQVMVLDTTRLKDLIKTNHLHLQSRISRYFFSKSEILVKSVFLVADVLSRVTNKLQAVGNRCS